MVRWRNLDPSQRAGVLVAGFFGAVCAVSVFSATHSHTAVVLLVGAALCGAAIGHTFGGVAESYRHPRPPKVASWQDPYEVDGADTEYRWEWAGEFRLVAKPKSPTGS